MKIPKHPTLIRRQLLARLKEFHPESPILAASLVLIHRRCGRPGCRCQGRRCPGKSVPPPPAATPDSAILCGPARLAGPASAPAGAGELSLCRRLRNIGGLRLVQRSCRDCPTHLPTWRGFRARLPAKNAQFRHGPAAECRHHAAHRRSTGGFSLRLASSATRRSNGRAREA